MSVAYDRAMDSIKKGLTAQQGGVAAEAQAATAYQAMVRAGEAAPLKRKYVTGKRLKGVR